MRWEVVWNLLERQLFQTHNHTTPHTVMSPRYEIVTINGRPYLLRIPSEKLNSANGAMPVMPKPALPTTTTTTTRNNHVEGNAPVDPPPQEEDPELLAQRQQRRAEDIRLIMKLGFAIWLFTQGAEWPKLLIVYTLALLIFLYNFPFIGLD